VSDFIWINALLMLCIYVFVSLCHHQIKIFAKCKLQ